ncbi:hypothetical protein PybrP1_002895, partial [[Pythium] brassicae (nom. inval.)]
MAHFDNCLKYASHGQFTIFHADATCKLSDIGYPVITWHHRIGADVSAGCHLRRQPAKTRDYALCFKSLTTLVRDLRGRGIDVDAIMACGKATADVLVPRAAQCPEEDPTHQHQDADSRCEGNTRMHYSESLEEYTALKMYALNRWRAEPELTSFPEHFKQQRLTGSRRRDTPRRTTPAKYSTPAPSDSSSAVITTCHNFFKSFLSWFGLANPDRRSYRITSHCRAPMYSAPHPSLLRPEAFVRFKQSSDCCLRVMHQKGRAGDGRTAERFADEVESPLRGAVAQAAQHSNQVNAPSWSGVVLAEPERVMAKRHSESTLNHKWRTADDGWLVDVDCCICQTKYFAKFLACAHVVIAWAEGDRFIPGAGDTRD